MRFLTIGEVIELHRRVVEQAGGSHGLRDLGALESAVAQPRMSFSGSELYPTLADKAAALGFSVIQNHPFIDGNKRAGHAAIEAFLILNDQELHAGVDESEKVILAVAAGEIDREDLRSWIEAHLVPLTT